MAKQKPVTAPDAVEVLGKTEEKVFYASQWRLMWWKFRRHKMAVIAGIVVVIMYLGALFAPFIAPYGATHRDRGN
ncbi:MAG: hypothetical protein GX228_07480, partial [Firmicutes bacterium]|nr:hypothetical protein [Bacillota bacterium]